MWHVIKLSESNSSPARRLIAAPERSALPGPDRLARGTSILPNGDSYA